MSYKDLVQDIAQAQRTKKYLQIAIDSAKQVQMQSNRRSRFNLRKKNLRGTRSWASRTSGGAGGSWSRPRRSTIFRPINENTTFRFQHTLVLVSSLYCGPSQSGFNLPGTTALTNSCGLQMYFSPQNVTIRNVNSGSLSAQVQNASSYNNIFEQVRLNSARVKVFWSATQGNIGVTSTMANTPICPILQTVFDADAGAPVPSNDQTIYPSYPGMKTCQLGSSSQGVKSGAAMVLDVVPRTQTAGANPNELLMPIGTWLSCENSGVSQPYYGQLFFVDFMQFQSIYASNDAIGVMSFYVTLDVEFKGLR